MRAPIVFLPLFVAAACATATSTVPLDDTVALTPGQAVRVDGSAARLTFLTVRSDSRCPVDVTCVWAGNAEVVLRLQDADAARDTTVVVNTGIEPRVAQIGSLAVELTGVTPSPRSATSTPASQYRATVILRRAP